MRQSHNFGCAQRNHTTRHHSISPHTTDGEVLFINHTGRWKFLSQQYTIPRTQIRRTDNHPRFCSSISPDGQDFYLNKHNTPNSKLGERIIIYLRKKHSSAQSSGKLPYLKKITRISSSGLGMIFLYCNNNVPTTSRNLDIYIDAQLEPSMGL